MPLTYNSIASVSPSGAADVTFTNIPSTYTDLVIVYHLAHGTGNIDIFTQFNGDTGSNYSATLISSNGTTVYSYRQSNNGSGLLDYYGAPGVGSYATNIVQIMSYANTNIFKTVLASASRADNGVDRNVVLWRNTNAITTIRLFPNTGTITGTASLYGIKAA